MKLPTLITRSWVATVAILAAGCDESIEQNPCGDGLELPGERFFPEGIAIAIDGRLFVGSFATGAIVRFADESSTAESLVSADGPLNNVIGMVFDEKRQLLWACNSNISSRRGASLVGIDPQSGQITVSHAFPSGGESFCNDVTVDEQGDVFATDSFGHRIMRLPAKSATTADALSVWVEAPAFQVAPGEFGLNGITNLSRNIYTVVYATGTLLRIPINPDGSAGTVEALTMAEPLAGPDGLKILGADTLGVVENRADRLTALTLRGREAVARVIKRFPDDPTTFDWELSPIAGWVVLSQFDALFANPPREPKLPFCLARYSEPSLGR